MLVTTVAAWHCGQHRVCTPLIKAYVRIREGFRCNEANQMRKDTVATCPNVSAFETRESKQLEKAAATSIAAREFE